MRKAALFLRYLEILLEGGQNANHADTEYVRLWSYAVSEPVMTADE